MYVKQVINDEFFWRDLVARLNLSNIISSELSTTLPNYVKNEVERILPSMIETKFLHYVIEKLPGHVGKEISAQMPSYLNNNTQMQQLFEHHKSSLRLQLESTVKEILDRLVNDPKYQEITNFHLAAINSRSDEKINEISRYAETQRKQQQFKFEQELHQMKLLVNQDMSELKNSLNEVQQLKLEITNVKEHYANEISNIKWIMAGASALIITITGVFMVSKN
jgi:hypothetical protein